MIIDSNVKRLGFGMMRLPEKDGRPDVEYVARMANDFYAAGFRYFDTAYGYHKGLSEETLREAVVKRLPRNDILIADKFPVWIPKTAEEVRGVFETQLARTGAGYFDYYLLHALNARTFKTAEELGIWDFISEQKRNGLVRHMGFSFHDSPETLDEILTRHPEAEFVQLQINYSDWEDDHVRARECYETVTRHGKPVIVMEPVRGGSLAILPDNVRSLLTEADSGVSTASWALRWVASLDNVMMILSGMSDEAQIRDNIKTFSPLVPMNDEEKSMMDNAASMLRAIERIPCTKCKYCMETCPKGIGITSAIIGLNEYRMFNNIDTAKAEYRFALDGANRATECIECGLCNTRCPQGISVMEHMAEANKLFG